MKHSLSKMNTTELRNLAASLGYDRKKLYGTSKQSLIIIIDGIEKNLDNDPAFQKRISEIKDYIGQNYKQET
ncbi:MAG: hypothetical protein RR150_07745 [Clostridia bacterium]